MLEYLMIILWFIGPAGFANMTPPQLGKIFPKLSDYPMDFYKTFRGIRIFGSHKTMRGLIFGTIVGGLWFIFQRNFMMFSFLPEVLVSLPWYFGFFAGFAALMGDAIKSFFKRQVGIPPGEPFPPFDQTDWLIGELIMASFFLDVTPYIIPVLLLGLFLHMLFKVMGYVLKIDDKFI